MSVTIVNTIGFEQTNMLIIRLLYIKIILRQHFYPKIENEVQLFDLNHFPEVKIFLSNV